MPMISRSRSRSIVAVVVIVCCADSRGRLRRRGAGPLRSATMHEQDLEEDLLGGERRGTDPPDCQPAAGERDDRTTGGDDERDFVPLPEVRAPARDLHH